MVLRDTLNANFKQLQEENKVNNAYLTGGISTEKKMLEQIKEMKRSTFDLSKFTVVGTPTVTNDGIASGFKNSTDVLKVNLDFTDVQTFSVKGKFYHEGVSNGGRAQNIISLRDATNNVIKLQLNNLYNGSSVVLCSYANSDTTTYNYGGWFPYTKDSWQDYEFVYDGTNIKFYLNGKLTYTSDNVDKTWLQHNLTMFIGSDGASQYAINYTGNLDIKDLIVVKNEIELFNGNKTGIDQITETIEIPYTLAKTGSKIVDAIYRDRVQDMYKQFGYAPYYTLSEIDFTLPMGEIYGMKADKSELDGQWVKKVLTVADSTAFDGTIKTYSLSDYLPNDNNIYEVYGYGIVTTGNVSGNSSILLLESDIVQAFGVCRAITRTTATSNASAMFIIPIGANRTLTMSRTSNTGTYQIYLRGYRRIK